MSAGNPMLTFTPVPCSCKITQGCDTSAHVSYDSLACGQAQSMKVLSSQVIFGSCTAQVTCQVKTEKMLQQSSAGDYLIP